MNKLKLKEKHFKLDCSVPAICKIHIDRTYTEKEECHELHLEEEEKQLKLQEESAKEETNGQQTTDPRSDRANGCQWVGTQQ